MAMAKVGFLDQISSILNFHFAKVAKGVALRTYIDYAAFYSIFFKN
jgi:hypothetical protein